MLLAPVTRALAGGAIVILIAGCGSASTPSVMTGQSLHMNSIQHSVPMRALPGPALTGPIMVPAVAPKNGPGYIESGATKTVYISAAGSNEVLLYNAVTGKATGKITQGLNVPFGLAIDAHGTLYVANLGNNTITEYLLGRVKPSFTIKNNLDGPYGVAVDSKGNVFASNLNNNTITGFHHLSQKTFETFSISGQAVGLGEDSHNTLYIASDSTNQVYTVATGTTSPVALTLSGLAGPICPSIGALDRLYVSDFGTSQVTVYPFGKSSPTETLTSGLTAPTFNGLVAGGLFFQTNQGGTVVAYKGTSTTPYLTISGISEPTGIAGWPRQAQ